MKYEIKEITVKAGETNLENADHIEVEEGGINKGDCNSICCYGINHGTVGNFAHFYSPSENYGNIKCNGWFGESRNHATIEGDGHFEESAENHGTVKGDGYFDSDSENHATIEGKGKFEGDSMNYGTVKGTVEGDGWFLDNSKNHGTVKGEIKVFNN